MFKRCSWTAKTLSGLGQPPRAFTVSMAALWVIFTVLMVSPATLCIGSMRIVKVICGLGRRRASIVSATFESLAFQHAKDLLRQKWMPFSPGGMALFG